MSSSPIPMFIYIQISTYMVKKAHNLFKSTNIYLIFRGIIKSFMKPLKIL